MNVKIIVFFPKSTSVRLQKLFLGPRSFKMAMYKPGTICCVRSSPGDWMVIGTQHDGLVNKCLVQSRLTGEIKSKFNFEVFEKFTSTYQEVNDFFESVTGIGLDENLDFLDEDLDEVELDTVNSVIETLTESAKGTETVREETGKPAPQQAKRFKSASVEDITKLRSQNTEKTTDSNTKWAVGLLKEIVLEAATAVTGLATTYYKAKMPDPTCIPSVDLDDQSYVLEDGSRTSKLVPKDAKYKPFHEGVETFYDIFLRGIQMSGNGPFLGTRSGPNQEYEWLSYQEVYDQSVAFGSWLLDQGIKSRSEEIIGIFSQNRKEWVISEKACVAYSLVHVALYDTLGDDAVVFIIKQTNMALIVCDVSEKANKLLKMVFVGKDKNLKTIVVMNGLDGVDMELARKVNVNVATFQEALEKGQSNLKTVQPPTSDDLALICYTSGTTGNPKGVMISYKQAMAQITSICINFYQYRKVHKDDVHLSYLPLAHMYERIVQQCFVMEGARIGFFRGDIKLLLDDLQTLKPTIFFSVPRLLNRVYDKVMAGVKRSKIKTMLFNWAISSKEKELKKYIIRKDSIWDKIVFKKIQALFGGRVDAVFTGSAPLEADVLTFFRCALGCVVIEGYGQTESVTAVIMSVVGDWHAGAVGPPLPYTCIKLFDAPEYNYFAKDNQGEVCAKGDIIASGYYKDPEKTAETFDKDGWLHTGDIGEWLPNGTLKIIDRKKNLFKLSQGEYVAPEKVELTYIRSSFVAQAFVEGDSLQPYVMAVVVPDEEVLIAWAKSQNISDSFQELCKSESIKDMILLDIQKVGREAGLKGFEIAKDISLNPELFSVENGLLTPTFKNKRPQLRSFFKNDIADLYKKH